ncbi:ATP-grasp domain-containing protein [Streptacidiphilus anmyonensis]|uniref:ATP-grasp domain-containing protein n=1 Tax=Streptacidiphilus anmyonensis TaxID=405782 RepID=UPI000A03C9D8|nr:ATP-grasp domain-containing protein [Streptacidiphilus anmyonensis]
MNTKTVVLVGVPWSVHELNNAIRDAAALGVSLLVVDTPESLAQIGGLTAVQTRAVEALDPKLIADSVRDIEPATVLAITEFSMELAAAVREQLGIPGTPSVVEARVLDKSETREVLRDHGLTKVGFHRTSLLSPEEDLLGGLEPPVVVKPRAFSGSHGVQFVADRSELARVFEPYNLAETDRDERDGRVAHLSGDRRTHEVIVEEYVPGTEISAEGLVVDGRLTLFTLTDKFNTGTPHFEEVGQMVPSMHTQERWAQVEEYLQAVVSALGFVTSPMHAEIKLLDDRVELVEIHTRYAGGRMIELLESAYELRPYEAYFDAMLSGRTPSRPRPTGQHYGVGFFTGRTDAPLAWPSYDFPHPGAVVSIDLDRRRAPKVFEYEGLRIRWWFAGHALFAAEDHATVHENISFLQHHTPGQSGSGGE